MTKPILDDVDKGFCVPLTLIMNFSLFQYLVTTFYRRRHERLVQWLLVIAFASFASLVPFALSGDGHARNLNDISEVCSVLTFLLQITIVTRDISKRMKIKSVIWMMRCGELLVIISLGVLVTNVIDLFAPVIDMDLVELLDSVVLHVSLVFIVGFRFHFLGMARGGAKGFWMRVTISMCLSLTIRQRLSSKSSKKALSTTKFGGTVGPHKSHFEQSSLPLTDAAVAVSPVKQTKQRNAKPSGAVAPLPFT